MATASPPEGLEEPVKSAALDEGLASILKAIETEPVPERLLDLACRLQEALRARKAREDGSAALLDLDGVGEDVGGGLDQSPR